MNVLCFIVIMLEVIDLVHVCYSNHAIYRLRYCWLVEECHSRIIMVDKWQPEIMDVNFGGLFGRLFVRSTLGHVWLHYTRLNPCNLCCCVLKKMRARFDNAFRICRSRIRLIYTFSILWKWSHKGGWRVSHMWLISWKWAPWKWSNHVLNQLLMYSFF